LEDSITIKIQENKLLNNVRCKLAVAATYGQKTKERNHRLEGIGQSCTYSYLTKIYKPYPKCRRYTDVKTPYWGLTNFEWPGKLTVT
jgi:hypothetical protein